MQTIEASERERELRARLTEFTNKLHQALVLVQDLEHRHGAAPIPHPGGAQAREN